MGNVLAGRVKNFCVPSHIPFLYADEKVKIRPVLFGGGQQRNLRSGTENVPAIAGMGVAVQTIYTDHLAKREKMFALKQSLMDGLNAYEGVRCNAVTGISLEETAPHILSVSFSGVKSEVLLHALADKGIYVSSGSACSSNHPELSGTLKAIGVEEQFLDSTLRFSFSTHTTEEEIAYAVKAVGEVLPVLRRFTRK